METTTRKYARSPRRYVWVLCLLAISCLVILASCDETPEPGTSPIRALATPEHAMLGYFGFETWNMSEMIGTLTISQTLRTVAGEILASRSYAFPIDVTLVDTSTIGTPITIDRDWPIMDVVSPVEEWTSAVWRVVRPDGEFTKAGTWYTDLDTPAEPGLDGAYLTREFNIWRVFFPIFLE